VHANEIIASLNIYNTKVCSKYVISVLKPKQ